MVGSFMRHRVVVLLAALAIAPAACSGRSDGTAGDARAAYTAALNRAQDRLAHRFAELQQHIGATSTPAQDRRTLGTYENAVKLTVRELRAVPPPAGLAPLHRRLVAEVDGYGAALHAIRGEIGRADARTVLAAQGRLSAAVARTERRIDAAIRAINRKLEG
jgi:hypothetical protein